MDYDTGRPEEIQLPDNPFISASSMVCLRRSSGRRKWPGMHEKPVLAVVDMTISESTVHFT
jgi:hypothetical protein